MFKLETSTSTRCDKCGAEDHGVKIEINAKLQHDTDRHTIIVHVACLLKSIGLALLK